jgi:hypothetical protein
VTIDRRPLLHTGAAFAKSLTKRRNNSKANSPVIGGRKK